MALDDPTKAIEVAEDFRRLLALNRQHYFQNSLHINMAVGLGTDRRTLDHPSRDQLIALQPLIEDIAREVDPDGDLGRFQEHWDGRAWAWESAEDAVIRLIGILRRLDDRQAIFGPRGPVLSAEGLHEWVWDAATGLWDDRHFKQAVHSATARIEEHTQRKLGRTDISGADLFSQAFTSKQPETDKPRLRFTYFTEKTSSGQTPQSWTSAHEGAMSFGRGCFQGIRNLQAHGTTELTEQEALEFLAALSVLARWVDKAEIVKAHADNSVKT